MTNRNLRIYFLMAAIIASAFACDKNTLDSMRLPKVATLSVEIIGPSVVRANGEVTDQGWAEVTSEGFTWGIDSVLSSEDSMSQDQIGTGRFSHDIAVIPDTTYFIQAYAKNKHGMSYGTAIEVNTNVLLPQLITTEVNAITPISASSGGNISSDGGSPIMARGICWRSSPNPTIQDNKTNCGAGTGNFHCQLTYLLPDRTYYVRAYATNSARTAYGQQISFRTIDGPIHIIHNKELVGNTGSTGGSFDLPIDVDGNRSVDFEFTIFQKRPHGYLWTDEYYMNSYGPGFYNSVYISQDTTFYSEKTDTLDGTPVGAKVHVRTTRSTGCMRTPDLNDYNSTGATERFKTYSSPENISFSGDWSNAKLNFDGFNGGSTWSSGYLKQDTAFTFTYKVYPDCYFFPSGPTYIGFKKVFNGQEKLGWIKLQVSPNRIFVFESELEN